MKDHPLTKPRLAFSSTTFARKASAAPAGSRKLFIGHGAGDRIAARQSQVSLAQG
jgi:hypothetical protein